MAPVPPLIIFGIICLSVQSLLPNPIRVAERIDILLSNLNRPFTHRNRGSLSYLCIYRSELIRMKMIAFSVFLLLYGNMLPAQWLITTNQSTRVHDYDVVPFGKNARAKGQYAFFGRAESMLENAVTEGIDPFQTMVVAPGFSTRPVPAWKVPLAAHLSFPENAPVFCYTNLYTRNVRSFTVWLHNTTGFWMGKEIALSGEKYTGPIEFAYNGRDIKIREGREMTEKEPAKMPLDEASEIDSILVTLTPVNENRPAECVIGECRLFQRRNIAHHSRAMFLYDYTGDTAFRPKQQVNRQFGSSYPFAQLVSQVNFAPSDFFFTADSAYSDAEREKAFFRLVRFMFEKYPFYREHKLDRQYFLAKLNDIERSGAGFQSQLHALQSLIRQYHDGHFRLDMGNEEKRIMGPIAARSFSNGVCISVVFDEAIRQQITPGMKIRTVNAVPVEQYIDSLARNEYGDSRERTELAISRLFYGKQNDSVRLELEDSAGAVKQVKFSYAGKITPPERFRPKHFQFYTNPEKWGYLRVNFWTMGSWINFFNLADTLKTLKGIVFDLRGNPGGAEIEPMRVASCFLKQPVSYAYCRYSANSVPVANILVPNPFLDLSHLQVKVLVDNKTACASEQFINILKKAVHAKVIGARATAGSYANAAYFYFPGNITLTTNVMQKTYLDDKGSSIEFTGIKPDKLVTLNSYKDLFGYDDKVLKEAMK